MGKEVDSFTNTVSKRWKKKMPKFFKGVFWVCSLISGTALAVNSAIQAAGATPHDWWVEIFPYLIGVPAGMAFAAKFTVNGGMNDNNSNTDDNGDNGSADNEGSAQG